MAVSPKQGTFVLSLDTELAWGTLDRDGTRVYARHLERTRDSIKLLLDLFARYDVPATWAMVGHLFLSSCERTAPGADPHPDVLTGRETPDGKPWHAADPGSDLETDPLWYGRDLVEMIRSASPQHEIACHTFSHLPFDHPAVDEDVARSQLAKCLEVADEAGIELRSFVFPRNRIAHLGVLRQQGFRAYRGCERAWYTGLPRPLARAAYVAHRALGLAPPVYEELEVVDGVVNVAASMFLLPADGPRSLIPGRVRERQALKGLALAAKREAVFHLWFHPWNVGGSPQMLRWLEKILARVTELRAQGRMRAVTMGTLGSEGLADDGAYRMRAG